MEQEKVLFLAQKMKGYLMKKSSQLLVGWQKRYWMVANSQLVYYADEALGQQKGAFEICDMTEIQSESTKQLHFSYRSRSYELKAQDTITRNQWVKCLKMLNQNLSKQELNTSLIVPSRSNSDVSKRKSVQQQRRSSSKLNKITLSKPIQSDKVLNDQSLLIAIGLDKLAKEIDNQRISSRILFTAFKEGYFFLISCKSLSNHYDDNEILPDEYVQPFEFNTLYKIRPGENTVKEITKASSIVEFKIKNDSEIVINCGFNFLLTTESNLNRFFQRMEKSVIFGRQYHNDKGIKLKKNIDSFVRKYDEYKGLIERRQKVKIVFQSYFVKLSSKNILKNPTDYQTLNTYVNFLTEDLKQFVDACMVKPIPRVDLLQQYAGFIHGKIYSNLHSYWNMTHMTMTTQEILKLAQLSANYCQIINKYIKDNRMVNGSGILASIYFRKILGEMATQIEVIRQKVSISTLEIKEDILTNKYPTEYCNLISKSLKKILSYTTSESVLLECCNFISQSFHLWINKISPTLDKCTDLNLIISFCNDTEAYNNIVFGVLQNILTSKGLSVNSYLRQIQSVKMNKLITDLHQLSIRRLFFVLFSSINSKLLTTKFLQIDVDALCKEVLSRLDTLHNVRESTYHDIQLQAVQQIISYYVSTLARIPPSTRISTDTLVKKINIDRTKLEEIFKATIKSQQMLRMLDQLIVVIEFLNADSAVTIRKHCLSFIGLPRNTYNSRLTKNLIELKYTLSTKEQAQLYRICEDIFTQMPEQRTKSEYQNEMFEPVSKESYMDSITHSGRRSTITMSLAERHIHIPPSEGPSHNGLPEGYLQRKKVAVGGKTKVFYEQKYFKLTPKNLECYQNKESKDKPVNLPILEIKKIQTHNSKANNFILELSNSKYKFMADSVRQCTNWVDAIQNAMNQIGKIEAKTFVVTQKNDLFVDYFANTKQTLKQSPEANNDATHRQSVLSTLSAPKNAPAKPSPIKISPQRDTETDNSPSPSPTKKKMIQPRVEAEPARGCWFGFAKCMKFE